MPSIVYFPNVVEVPLMLEDYSVEDLTRAFFRQFLIQNRFGKTYEAFQSQDIRSSLKISKATLIRSLCMEYLIAQNKKLDKPFKSLAEILISYLKNKYAGRQKENHLEKVDSEAGNILSKPDITPEIRSKENWVQGHPITIERKQEPKPMFEEEFLPSRVTAMRRLNKKEPKGDASVTTEDKDIPRQGNGDTTSKPTEDRAFTQNRDIAPDSNIKKKDEPPREPLPELDAPPEPQKFALPKPTLSRLSNQPEPQKKKPAELEQAYPKGLQPQAKVHSATEHQQQPIVQPPERKMMMFGKRKQQSAEDEKKQHEIFSKFTEPMQLQPKEKYVYSKIDLNSMVTRQPLITELSYKRPQQPLRANAKKKEKPISYEQSSRLRKILFQGQSKGLPKAWCQGLLLSPYETTYYGLEQLEGGPCGLVAALQCYYLKHLLYLCPNKSASLEIRQNCLFAAAAQLLLKMNQTKVVIALPTVATVYSNEPVSVENLELLTVPIKNLEHLFEQLYQYKTSFMGRANHGYTLLLYSCILTKGFEEIEKEMDSSLSPLIGNHGHCNQELVNLFLTGRATTNCFDGEKVFGDGTDKMVLKGIAQPQEFGFLTIFESLGYIEVGRNLKNPSLPIWVICKEFHYHVVFGTHHLISSDSSTEQFDLVYFDGLYNCKDRIVMTLTPPKNPNDPPPRLKDLPMIQQVLLTKWGRRSVDWNGSIPIL